MHTIFQPGFPGLLEAIYIQERLIEMLMPAVYKSFVRGHFSIDRDIPFIILMTQEKHMISSTSYTTKWYITLFANTVPFQTQLRIWDAFLLEGRDVIIVVAVAIIWDLKGAFDRFTQQLILIVLIHNRLSGVISSEFRNHPVTPLFVLCSRR